MSDIELTALLISGAVGLLVPWLTESVTHSAARVELKSAITAALSAIVGAVSTVAVVPGAHWQAYLLAIGAAWVASMRTYFAGVVRPVAPHSGVGAPPSQHSTD
ncbi:hypothetical protein [Saccharopolyspora sp. 6V]|uniref:hypothetical protein n=1 Tax=Saccharopolyspora sp. 6V TaxID=2877239 RepID=UPI001CD5B536|nr:hypothetical protein [Saccharopolyspora sp. 6V]MCA1191603.1 hypothetical protein [Saccharopolyspora sp. 6V]